MDGIRWAWVPGLAILLSSCGIPDLNQAEPGPELPFSFNGVTSEENVSQIPIEEFFGDSVLTNLIDEGLAGNQQLKILAQDIAVANNEILARRGAYLPFVNIGGRAGLEKPSQFTPLGAVDDQLESVPGKNFPTPLPNFLMAANLSWQLDIWRQLRNSRDAATLRYFGTIEGRNYVVTRLVADIAENYFKLMANDKRIENLERIIGLQEDSLVVAEAHKAAGRGTELGVQRFVAEVAKNKSELLIIRQEIIERENEINFLLGRYPQVVERMSAEFFDLNLHELRLGVPSELLQYRPDVREAERQLGAAGLDILVAKANFYPKGILTSGVGWEAFNTRYLFQTPESLIYNVAGELVAPLINKMAIRADYQSANAKQLAACYNYQRVLLNAFTEVINRVNKVQNYSRSVELKKEQLVALEASVTVAGQLFIAGRVEYIDVLFAQRDLADARMVLIETKQQQLTAIVDTYQALGGGLVHSDYREPIHHERIPTPPAMPSPPLQLVPPLDEGLALAPAAPDLSGEKE